MADRAMGNPSSSRTGPVGNNIGTEMAARSPADGYTPFMANTVNTINNSLHQKLNYNFIPTSRRSPTSWARRCSFSCIRR